MLFNDLKVGMIVGEVISDNDDKSAPEYHYEEILNIKSKLVDIRLITFYYYNNKFIRAQDNEITVGPKFFGISKPLSELNEINKINYIKAIFESE